MVGRLVWVKERPGSIPGSPSSDKREGVHILPTLCTEW